MNRLRFGITRFCVALFIALASGIFGQRLEAQNYIIDPSADGGFEGTHGWTIVNTTNVNKWITGSAEKTAGSSGAYISDNNSTNTITNPQATNSKIYIYKDVVVPLNATSITVSFKYKNAGTDAPPPRCMFERTSAFPSLPTDGNSGLIGGEFVTVLNNSSGWITYTNTNPFTTDRPATYSSAPLIPGTSYRIVFEWSAAYQTSLTQVAPFCTMPSSGSISGNMTVTPGTDETYTVVTTGGGNFVYTWSLTGGSTIVSGQGTSSIVAHIPTGYKSGGVYCNLTCPSPVYTSNGKNSGALAIDEISITYVAVPKITSFNPTTAAVGSSVTITGEYFGATASDNIVTLGGVRCPVTAASATSITVTVPSHATYNNFTVLNTTANLTAVSLGKFIPVNTNLSGIPYTGYASGQNGSFEPALTFTASALPSSPDQKFTLADIDRDGKIDIVSNYKTSGVPQVYRNTSSSGSIVAGSLTLSAPAGISPSIAQSGNVLATDLNNDGKVDIAASNGNVDGGFANINSSTSGTVGLANYSSILSSLGNYKVSSSFLTMDINLDGRIDIMGISSGNPSNVFFTRNSTTGTSFSATTGNPLATGSVNKILSDGNFYSGASGDMNADGKPDMILGGSAEIYALQNTTLQGAYSVRGFSFSEPLYKATAGGNANAVKLADLDGDGKPDVIATNATSANISVFRNTSTAGATITLDAIQNFSSTLATGTYGLAVADMNGDSKPDLIFSNNSSGIAYLANTSVSGTISFAASVTIIPSGAYTQLEIADMDGDNKPDIIAAGATTTISIFRNRQTEAGVISADQAVCSGSVPAGLTSVSVATFASGTPNYLWQTTTTMNGTWSTAAGTSTNESYTPSATISATTFFRRRAESSAVVGTYYYSSPVTVTVTAAPTITGTTAATGCGTSTVSLAATSGAGNTIQWFTASSGGTSIGSGSPWVTPTISSNTTYYAGAITSNGCLSGSRTGVLATINTSAPTITGPTAASRCDAGSVTLSATASTTVGTTINWYSALTGGSPVGTGSAFVTPEISSTTTYYVDAVNCIGTTASRTAVIATINITPTIVSTIPASGCQSTNVVLSAVASSGTLNWYNVASGGSPSSVYATVSVISTTTTRWVSAISAAGSCESPRVPVIATMNPLPAAATTSGTTLCGLGTATVSATPPTNGSIAWYSESSGGTLLGSGTSYTSPQMSASASYYALATDANGCIASARTIATITYNGPTAGAISNLNAVTNSSSQSFAATGLSGQTSFIWQRSKDAGTTWADISASLDPNVTYSGFSGTTGTTSTLTLSVALPGMHLYQYRLKLTGATGSCVNYSNSATLYVADVFGGCDASPQLSYGNNYNYTALNTTQTMWSSKWSSYIGYTYQSGSLTDNLSNSGLIVGNNGTGGSAYIYADLGSSKVVNRVYLQGIYNNDQNTNYDYGCECYTGGNLDYGNWDGGEIQVSADNITYTTVYSNVQGTYQAGADFSFAPVTARYVRAYKLTSNSALAEFHIFAPDLTAPYVKIAPSSVAYVSTGGTFAQTVSATAGTGSITSNQWSFSADNGTFSNLSNGTYVTGATTATLNILNFGSSNVGYYKLTAAQTNGCSVSTTIKANLVAPFYSSVTGAAGALQTLANWGTNSNGVGTSAPADFNAGKFFILANGTSTYTVGAAWTVGGTLRINGKILTLGNYNATIGNILEGSSTAYVKTNGTGKLISSTSSTPNLFPVGNSTYDPVTITNNTGTDDNFSVGVSDAVLTNGSTGTAMTNVANRTWTINKVTSSSTSAGYGVNLTFEWQAGDVSGTVVNPVLYAYSGSSWVAQTAGSVSRTATSVTYTQYNGTLSNTMFMLANAVPVITSFTPTSTGNGFSVVITGTAFSNATAVSFGGTAATSFVVNSATQITAVVAAGTSGNVSVTTPGGTATLSGFTFVAVPTISYFTPARANAGTTVTITGTNFSNATGVTFGGTAAASFTVVSSTQITAVVRTGTTGSTVVTTQGGTATKAGFVYGLPYTSLNVLAAWSQTNTSTQSYSYSATVKSASVSAAGQNFSGLTTVNNVQNKWQNTNSSASLVIASAPYVSYSVTTTSSTKFDRFVIPGLNVSGTTKMQLRWSVDAYAGSLGEFTSGTGTEYASSSIDLISTAAQAPGTIEFRIYMYNGNTDLVSQTTGNNYSSSDGTNPALYGGAYSVMIFGAVRTSPSLGTIADIVKNIGDPAFFITTPSTNSTGAITYTLDNAAVATVSGSRVSISGTGTATLTSTLAATDDYNQATTTAEISVKSAPVIVFQNMHKTIGNTAFSINASSTSSGSIIYTSGTPGTATISGNTVTLVAAGSTIITATQAAEGIYNSATSSAVLTVGTTSNSNPTLVWVSGFNKTLGNAAFGITTGFTSTSSGAYSYYSGNTSVASLSSSTATMVGAGISVLTTIQAANGSYNAGSISTVLTVGKVGKTDPTLSGFPAINKYVNDPAFSISAPTSNSEGSFFYLSSNPAVAVVNGTTITITGSGTCNIIAVQYAYGNYNAGTISSVITVNQVFTYSTPNVFTKSSTITNLSPALSPGTATAYSVSPTLPRGLSINANTGVISGTPTMVNSNATYTVTAINSGGTSTANLDVRVNDLAPATLSYTTPNVYSVGTGISILTPTTTGGEIAAYSVSPALPDGLVINDITGEISGTPAAAEPETTYVVTGSNTGGSKTANVIITVTDQAPATLSYSTPNTLAKGNIITPLNPSYTGGVITGYSVSPALPSGLTLNTTTGVISGTPTGVISSFTTYTVTGTNTGGSITKAVEFKVNDAAPAELTYTTPNQFSKNVAITSLTPSSSGGAVSGYTVVPDLPAGLVLNSSTGVISGTPTTITATATYIVRAANFVGSSTASVEITVNDTPPSGLTYPTPNVYTKGTAISNLSPTVSGGAVVSYSVSPDLPSGLVLNSGTGVISGTPTLAVANAIYVVTATNSGGSTTANVSIKVNDTPPNSLTYSTTNVYSKGTAINDLTPTVSGGTVISYSVSPSLPAGLTINTGTGVIRGTPSTVAAMSTYVVTATNSGGNTTADVSISVKDILPASLSYSTPNVYTRATAITSLSPAVSGGAVISYSVDPALPSGLTLNTESGVISGTPSSFSAQATYVVTATNTGGSTTANVVITINNIIPSVLSYSSPKVYTRGTAITNLSPSVSGGAVISYSVGPALPAGLSLNTTTGVISGTPSSKTTIASYVVTATNSGGSTTASVSITVNAIAPGSMSYSIASISAAKDVTSISTSPTVSGDAVDSYSISPALPAGVTLNTITGEITGTPGEVSSQTTYTITATNSGGSTTTSFTLSVNPCTNPTGGGTISSNQEGCYPFDPVLITSSLDPPGYSGTLESKWMKSTVSSTVGFEEITGSNALTYDPGLLTQTTWYKRVTRVTCKSNWIGAMESNVVKMTVDPVSVGGAVTSGESHVFPGNSTGTMTLGGYTGTIVKWQKMVGSGSWVDIACTAATYSETPSSEGIWKYRAQIKSGVCSEAYSESVTIIVSYKTAATVTLGELAQTYSGTGKTATATTSPAGLTVTITYNGSSTLPVNAGTYTVVGTISDNDYMGSATAEMVISKAVATITLSNLSVTYDGGAKAPVVTTNPSGLNVIVSYSGISKTPPRPVNAGSYGVTATISDNNYQGTATGTLVISKASALVTLGGLTATYNGTAHAATTTTLPADFTTVITYNGSSTVPVNAGTYTVVGTVTNDNYQGSATGSMVISKAAAIVTLTINYTGVYDGSTHGANATTSPSGMTVNITYNGSSTVPVNAGTYTVTATVSNTNYQATATGTIVITKASQTITSFSTIPEGLRMTQEYELVATASSGLAVTFESSDPALVTIEGNTLTVTGDGPVTITAKQAGDNNYNAAVAVSQEILTLPTFDNVNSLFSPNGDGMNEYWYIPDIEQYGVLQVAVYNRYGMKVYETSSYSNNWDGTWNGYQLPSASYYYIFKSSELGMFKGIVNIVR